MPIESGRTENLRSSDRCAERYGLPEVIRVDKGSPFGSRGVCGLSRLSAWWLLLGIRVEFIEPGHPEQRRSLRSVFRPVAVGISRRSKDGRVAASGVQCPDAGLGLAFGSLSPGAIAVPAVVTHHLKAFSESAAVEVLVDQLLDHRLMAIQFVSSADV